MAFNRIRRRLSRLLDITGDVLLDECCLRIEGNRRIYVENQKGIKEYTNEFISIAVKSGFIKITGEEMELQTLALGQIIITGKILGIEFIINEAHR